MYAAISLSRLLAGSDGKCCCELTGYIMYYNKEVGPDLIASYTNHDAVFESKTENLKLFT